MIEIHKAKSLTQVHFRLRRDEMFFFFEKTKKQQTNTLFEQESS